MIWEWDVNHFKWEFFVLKNIGVIVLFQLTSVFILKALNTGIINKEKYWKISSNTPSNWHIDVN